MLKGERLVPLEGDITFSHGQHVLVIGFPSNIEPVIEFLGRPSHLSYALDTDRERMMVVATSNTVVGHSLKQLRVWEKFQVTIARIVRNNVSFITNAQTSILDE